VEAAERGPSRSRSVRVGDRSGVRDLVFEEGRLRDRRRSAAVPPLFAVVAGVERGDRRSGVVHETDGRELVYGMAGGEHAEGALRVRCAEAWRTTKLLHTSSRNTKYGRDFIECDSSVFWSSGEGGWTGNNAPKGGGIST